MTVSQKLSAACMMMSVFQVFTLDHQEPKANNDLQLTRPNIFFYENKVEKPGKTGGHGNHNALLES